MDLGLRGKSAVVTGGSRGIGLAIAKGFAAEGVDVSICARSSKPLAEAVAALKDYGVVVHSSVCDVSDSTALHDHIHAAKDTFGKLNILVNNPAGFGRSDDEKGWKVSIDVDLMASVRACWAAVQLWPAGCG